VNAQFCSCRAADGTSWARCWLFWIAVPAERWEDSLLRFRKAREYGGEGPPKWDWQDDLLLEPGDRFAVEMAEKFHQLRPTLPGLNDLRGRSLGEVMAWLQLEAWDKSKRQRGWMTLCHLTVLPSGRILLPLYSDGFLACLMAISDDYERFLPLAGSSGTASWPITHITTGGGGAGLAPVYPHPALAAYYSTNHFVVFEATATTLKRRMFTANSTLLDEFELKKVHGQLSAEYLAQVYPEDALKLFYEAGSSLTASLAASLFWCQHGQVP
jgi:hypothetical protein